MASIVDAVRKSQEESQSTIRDPDIQRSPLQRSPLRCRDGTLGLLSPGLSRTIPGAAPGRIETSRVLSAGILTVVFCDCNGLASVFCPSHVILTRRTCHESIDESHGVESNQKVGAYSAN